ncbi:MAG TPA: DUF4287 domain-containing protein [Longimicrobiales bacterium]|nr:DUF4287 domain-containing protein [Longimicrobiales bacterium]
MATPEEMAASMIQNLPEKTGRDLVAWREVVAASGLEKHGQIVKMLKTEHGVSHGYANLIAHEARRTTAAHSADEDLMASQYAGPKADLTVIRDAILTEVTAFGDDVEVAPKKTYASLRRSKQFAIVQPSTKTRVDVGLNLGADRPTTDRLEASGSFNAMVSHRVRVSDVAEVDDELIGWLREAYEGA